MNSLPWWKTAVFYQIYPRSFYDTDRNGIGDLPGIIAKLDYLCELGVTALWISPFFSSPMDDFGYDISNYCDVDELFGSLDDARQLIAEAHRRNIRVIFDLVINHTSDKHPWFLEASSSRDNPKHDWYIWKPMHDRVTGKALPKPNNWVCQFEFTSAWWPNPATDEWYLATFTRHQPEVDWRNTELRAAMYDALRFWLDMGVDGFRMDVVNWYIKDPLFRSNPYSLKANPDLFQKHLYDRNQAETHEICRDIRRIVDSYPGDRMLVGEIFTQDASLAASYQGNGNDELHMAFNMEMLYLKWNGRSFVKALNRWYSALPEEAWPNLTMSNHDQWRHATRFWSVSNRERFRRLQITAMLLLTVRGTPFIYYGEEIGMTNRYISKHELVDPTGKTFWPLPIGRDGQRTPMQWSDAENAGFSESGVKPWLPINEKNYRRINVRAAQKNPLSLWHWYRRLIELRKKEPVLQTGKMLILSEGVNSILAYRRSPVPLTSIEHRPEGCIDCYLNFAHTPRLFSIPQKARVLFGNSRQTGEILPKRRILLAPHEALLVTFIYE